MSYKCEIRDNTTGDRLDVVEYETIPQIGFHIQFGETVAPVKKVLLKPSPSRRNAGMTDECSTVIYV